MTRNEIHDNCIGIYVDPGIAATITRNDIFDNNACPDLTSSGRGITLSGAQGSVVSHNVFRGHSVGGLPALLVTDDSNHGDRRHRQHGDAQPVRGQHAGHHINGVG